MKFSRGTFANSSCESVVKLWSFKGRLTLHATFSLYCSVRSRIHRKIDDDDGLDVVITCERVSERSLYAWVIRFIEQPNRNDRQKIDSFAAFIVNDCATIVYSWAAYALIHWWMMMNDDVSMRCFHWPNAKAQKQTNEIQSSQKN